MKFRFLATCLVSALVPFGMYAGDSPRFTLNTRKANFVIMEFASPFCDGFYGGGKRAYFLAGWDSIQSAVGRSFKVRFVVVPGSSEIIRYAYYVNGVQIGAETSSRSFEFDICNRNVGDKLEVVGIDSAGYRTPPFRANFDIIPASKWFGDSLFGDFGNDGKYTLSGGSTLWNRTASYGGEGGAFPKLGSGDRTEVSMNPSLKIATEFNCNGSGNSEFYIGCYQAKEKLVRNRDHGKFAKGFANGCGFDFGGSFTGRNELRWDHERNEYISTGLSGEIELSGQVKSADWRPSLLAGIGYLKFSAGIDAQLGLCINATSGNSLSDIIGFRTASLDFPIFTLTGGVGWERIHAEVSGKAWVKWGIDRNGLKSVSGYGELGANVQCYLFYDDEKGKGVGFDKDFKLFNGSWDWYSRKAGAGHELFGSSRSIAFDFRPLKERRRDTTISAFPLFKKSVASDERVLATDIPIESISETVFLWDGSLCCAMTVDDTSRSDMNVSKLTLLMESTNSTIAVESPWDDGRNDFEPSLSSMPAGGIVVAWSKASREWGENEKFSDALSSLDIVAAFRSDGGVWHRHTLSSPGNGSYDHSVSVSADGDGRVVAVWIRNANGKLIADAENPDSLIYSIYDGTEWSTESILVSNAGRVNHGSLIYSQGNFFYVYSADETFSGGAMSGNELYLAKVSNGGTIEIRQLTENSVDDDLPALSYKCDGNEIHMAWMQGTKLLACRNFDMDAAEVVWDGGEHMPGGAPVFINAPWRSSHVGIAMVGCLTNCTVASHEILYCEPRVSNVENGSKYWNSMVALTDNNVTEQYLRPALDADGNIRILYAVKPDILSTNDFTRYGTLKELVHKPTCDFAIDDEVGIVFGNDIEIGSNTTIAVSLQNRGLVAAQSVTNAAYGFVRFYRGDARIAEIAVTNLPAPGESVLVEARWMVAMSTTNAPFRAIFDEDHLILDVNRSNNSISRHYFDVDLVVDSVKIDKDIDGYTLTALVGNTGLIYSANEIPVEFRIGSTNGFLLGTDTIGNVGYGSNLKYAATTRVDSSVFETNSNSIAVYAVVNSARSIDESRYDNNTGVAWRISDLDSDGDGLTDSEETEIGANPHNTDSDGDGISDFDEVRTYGSSPTNFSYRITFDAGRLGAMYDGATSALVVADSGTSPRPASVTPHEGYRFTGWEEEMSPATGVTTYHAKYEEIAWYVNATTGNDTNSGEHASEPWKTLQHAVNNAPENRRIYVADGIYEPFICTNRNIIIESVNGPRYAIIDGGKTNRCATLGTSAGHTNTVLRGFTLRNGNASGSAVKVSRNYGGGAYCGTIEGCRIYGNTASCGGGISYSKVLDSFISGNNATSQGGAIYLARQSYVQRIERCSICQNSSSGSPVQIVGNGEPVVINGCLIAENFYRSWLAVNDETGDHRLTITNTTIVGNSSLPSNTSGVGYATVIDSIVWDNFSRPYRLANHASSRFQNSCTYPLPSGVGNIEDDPQFVDEAHHVYLLKPGSPCAGAATDGGEIGATGVAAEGGFVVGTETDGYGLILESGTVVEQGGTASFTAVEIGREFLHFKTNGVFATAEHVIDLTNIKSDILVTAVFGKRELFVDGTNGNDGNNGLSWMMAKKSISSAINDTLDYDTIFVTNGVYGPITPSWKKILIQSANGASDTIIDGGGSSQCINCLENGSGITNAVIVGFTLRNGFSVNYGGGAVGGVLRDCIIVDCEATTYGGGACYSHLENCVVARNKAGTYGGGTYYGYADHCTICGNEAGASSGGSYYGTFYNSIVSKNFVGGNEANWINGTFFSCCTYPNRGSDPVVGDPMLVDGWNGDARLRIGSPCIVGDVQICGAYVGEPLEGISISVGVQGTGSVSNNATLVTSGGSATIEAVETVRPFLYWNINGEQITNQVYTLTNITSDVRAIAVFGSFDWYVDAEYGDDANDGSDWDVAKRTLQAAVAAAVDEETIYVEAGTYEPIFTNNKRIRIESMNGAEMTFIDGGGTNRCATLGSTSTHTNSALIGFTLLNGRAPMSGRYAYGGGSYYGTLEYCIISNCVASGYYAYGGGAYYGYLNNCLVAFNCATSSSYRAYGGGAYSSVLRSCTVAKNCAVGSNAAYYGGVYGGWNSAYNTIIWDNEVVSSSANYPNTYATYLNYCCTDGSAPYRQTGTITNDPQFVDVDAGDFHLRVGSPCLNTGYNWYVQGDMDLDWDDRVQGARVDVGCYEGAEYAAPPGQVTGLVAVRGVLTWDAMPDAEGFMVYRSTRRAASSAKYIGIANTNAYTDETAVDGTTYYYWVQAFNTLGMGVRSDGVETTWPLLLTITTSELPDATEMVEYWAQLEATGGTPPYSWSCPARGYVVSTNAASTFAEVGTAQGWHADDNCWSLELPFDFPFYGNKYRTVYVNSNGTLTFDGDFDRWSYSVQNFTNRAMIATVWADLTTENSGDVYVSANSDAVTICWECQYRSYGGSVAASATLYANGTIRLSYGSGNANGGFVGVSAGDGLRYTSLGTGLTLNAAQDIILRGGGITDGLFISENGQITGRPTEAGTNTFTVIVTDAAGDVEEKELSIVVKENPNHKPEIDNVSPVTNVYVKVGDSATFAVAAHDPEGAMLEYSWYLDGEEIEYVANSYTFTATLEDAGAHTLECVVSDGLWTDMVRHRWSFRVVRDWYVDALAEDDSGDGASSDSALYSISEALWYAEDGDTIYVAPGLYDDYLEFDSGRTVSIIATGGTSRTFFTGVVDGYDTEWYPGEAVMQSTMRGFTFRGCYLGSVTLDDCVLTCDEMGCYPSGVYGCRLFDCSVTGNVCDYSPIQRCELMRCTVAGNTVGEYGAIGYSSYVYDCIVWDNVTVNGETSNYDTETWYDEWWDDDAEEYVSEEYAEVHIFNSCTWPMPSEIAGTDNITSDPRLVDAVNGDLRLRVGSPCLVGGVQAMGVYLGDPVAGFVLSVRIEGSGAVSPMTAVVSNGGNATFEVADNTRPFLGFSTNGVFATAADTLTWQGVKSDGIITAVFSNFTFYVDAAAGDDANDGLSWATARASIQSVINDAVRGETIYVKAGTYDPIVVGAAMRLRIESVDGKEATVIDGGGERQCANLGGYDSFSSTLVGFTLTNGYSGYGGGVYGGTLIDCDVTDNYAMYQGGGLYFSTAVSCQILDNRVGDTNLWRNANGGGAYGGSLINCLVANNVIDSNNYCEGGGTCNSDLYNCTVVKNVAYGNGYSGGVYGGCLYNTIVYGNFAEYGKDIGNLSSWYIHNSLVGEDPGFIDAENGDYRLSENSPCIDAGSNSYVMEDTDLDGNVRIQHYTVDIGCYEYELATPERDTEADFATQMSGTCYGIFVGVGRYTYMSSLIGPTIDATNMQTRCVDKGYWRDENTFTLLDTAATKSVVRARLATLAAKAVSGDTVLYYQSSHGGSHTSGGNYTKDAYICLHDERYEDYEMAEDLMQFAAGVKVVIILDTCHSAGMFKAMGMSSTSSAKSFALRVRDLMAERSILRKSAKSGITADDIGWIAAADFNQYSWDSLSGGAFTVAMLDGWKSGEADYDGDNRLNFHELWRYAKGIATGYYGEDATDAQCLNENVLLSRFAGTPDSTSNGESTETTPAPVEHVWLDSYPAILAAFGGDYEAMANAPSPGASGSGKIWPNGSPCYMWQDFVAGTSPTNDAVFTATIRMDGDTPVITWEPDTPELRATRVYRTYGKKTLMDANWTDITDKDMSEYNFFKVTVDLP